MRSMLFMIGLGMVLAAPVWAERTIAVTGQGVVEAAPDMAVVSMGVVHEARTAREALDRTNAATGLVLARLEALGIAARDMQTSDLSLNPVWSNQRSSNSQPPRIVGFTASNRLRVRVRDLEALGEVLDTVVTDGANQFDGLRFDIQEPRPLQDEARRRAVSDARAKAALYAEAAGVQLGAVQSLSEAGSRSPRPQMMDRAAIAMEAVPVASGELSLTASVSMVFLLEE